MKITIEIITFPFTDVSIKCFEIKNYKKSLKKQHTYEETCTPNSKYQHSYYTNAIFTVFNTSLALMFNNQSIIIKYNNDSYNLISSVHAEQMLVTAKYHSIDTK